MQPPPSRIWILTCSIIIIQIHVNLHLHPLHARERGAGIHIIEQPVDRQPLTGRGYSKRYFLDGVTEHVVRGAAAIAARHHPPSLLPRLVGQYQTAGGAWIHGIECGHGVDGLVVQSPSPLVACQIIVIVDVVIITGVVSAAVSEYRRPWFDDCCFVPAPPGREVSPYIVALLPTSAVGGGGVLRSAPGGGNRGG